MIALIKVILISDNNLSDIAGKFTNVFSEKKHGELLSNIALNQLYEKFLNTEGKKHSYIDFMLFFPFVFAIFMELFKKKIEIKQREFYTIKGLDEDSDSEGENEEKSKDKILKLSLLDKLTNMLNIKYHEEKNKEILTYQQIERVLIFFQSSFHNKLSSEQTEVILADLRKLMIVNEKTMQEKKKLKTRTLINWLSYKISISITFFENKLNFSEEINELEIYENLICTHCAVNSHNLEKNIFIKKSFRFIKRYPYILNDFEVFQNKILIFFENILPNLDKEKIKDFFRNSKLCRLFPSKDPDLIVQKLYEGVISYSEEILYLYMAKFNSIFKNSMEESHKKNKRSGSTTRRVSKFIRSEENDEERIKERQEIQEIITEENENSAFSPENKKIKKKNEGLFAEIADNLEPVENEDFEIENERKLQKIQNLKKGIEKIINILDRNYNKESIEKNENNQDSILKPNISQTKNSARDSNVSGIRSSLLKLMDISPEISPKNSKRRGVIRNSFLSNKGSLSRLTDEFCSIHNLSQIKSELNYEINYLNGHLLEPKDKNQIRNFKNLILKQKETQYLYTPENIRLLNEEKKNKICGFSNAKCFCNIF